MDSTAELEAPATKHGQITSENARALAARSVEVRRQRREAEDAVKLLAANPADRAEHVTLALSSVRAQIKRLNAKLLREDDANKLDRLASALAKLTEVERVLSGQPLPGALRPSKDAPKATPSIRAV